MGGRRQTAGFAGSDFVYSTRLRPRERFFPTEGVAVVAGSVRRRRVFACVARSEEGPSSSRDSSNRKTAIARCPPTPARPRHRQAASEISGLQGLRRFLLVAD